MKLDFWEWLDLGKEKGWVSDVWCVTHDGFLFTDEEYSEFEDDHDVCMPVVRVWGQEKVFNED